MNLKKCTKCKEEKLLQEYSWRKYLKTLMSCCKNCANEYAKKRYKKDPIAQKIRVYKTQRGLRKRNRDYIIDAKKKACTDCKITYPTYVMDLDHLPGTNKRFALSKMSRTYSLKEIQKEIDKCEVVCANCHRERTNNRYIEK